MIQAVIQAGGKGSRLSAITKNEIPKPMIDIWGKPLLKWQIETLKENGIQDFIIIVGHLGNVIMNYFGNGNKMGVHIEYIIEQRPLGTAGGLFYLKKFLKNRNFIFVYGDLLFDIDVNRMIEFHKKNKSVATLFVHPNSHPFDSDIVLLNENSKVVKFDFKNNMRNYWCDNKVNAGFFIFDVKICDLIKRPQNLAVERDVISILVKCGENVFGYQSTEYIKDVGTVERLTTVNKEFMTGLIKKRNLKNKQKCIFLDRDGTINRANGLIDTEDKLELEKGAIEAIGIINKSEYLAIVVTNQPVIARGNCTVKEVVNINNKMQTLLGKEGVYLDDIAFCPHHPDKGYLGENRMYKVNCNCRKPKIGMLVEMVEKYNIDLLQSWIIGDTTVDLQTGENAGLKKVLVLTGEAGEDGKYNISADFVEKNLLQAVKKIIGNKKYE